MGTHVQVVLHRENPFEDSPFKSNGFSDSDELHTGMSNGGPTKKSLIQQRIELLYGPDALAAGFKKKLRPTLSEKRHSYISDSIHAYECEGNPGEEEYPVVFRHLRPEFRHQLPVRLKKGTSVDSVSLGTLAKVSTSLYSLTPLYRQGVQTFTSDGTGQNDVRKVTHKLVTVKADHKTVNESLTNGHTDCNKNDDKILSGNSGSNHRTQRANFINGHNTLSNDFTNGSKPDSRVTYDCMETNAHRAENHKILAKECSDSCKPKDDCVEPENVLLVSVVQESDRQIKDGYYFLEVVQREVNHIEAIVRSIEEAFGKHEDHVTDDVRGKVLAAIGKAKLLISQKIEQFKGLCYKNIRGSDDHFSTTSEDLAGFWDMVMISVQDVNSSLAEVVKLKENNWTHEETCVDVTSKKFAKKISNNGISVQEGNKNKEEKKGEENRKKKADERRQAMKEMMRARKSQIGQKPDIEIFVPSLK